MPPPTQRELLCARAQIRLARAERRRHAAPDALAASLHRMRLRAAVAAWRRCVAARRATAAAAAAAEPRRVRFLLPLRRDAEEFGARIGRATATRPVAMLG
jgi:hypothetical protein